MGKIYCKAMSTTGIPLLLTVGLSLLCVIADCLLKRASTSSQPFTTPSFLLALTIYAASSVGWIYILRHFKLAIAGAIFSITIVTLLAVCGVLFFGERLRPHEIAGLVCAVLSLILLSRFT